MKSFVVFALVFAVALAAPAQQYNGDEKNAEIVKNVNDVGVYEYKADSETSNGIKKEESGQLTNAGTDNEAFVVRGSYSYIGTDGQTYTVTYTADAEGFHPSGAHIPV